MSKKFISTHDLTINGDVVKAGTEIPAAKLSADTIKQYTEGGILSEVAKTPKPSE